MTRDFHEHPEIGKFYLVSRDGDFFKTVQYLKEQDKISKILFPSRRMPLHHTEYLTIDISTLRYYCRIPKLSTLCMNPVINF